jgi:hypothetical protein
MKEGEDLGEMRHPTDGEAWEDFDKNWPDFSADARNIRLGLATDGFNPYNNMIKSYSMWPVFVIPYNFTPWGCMEQSNFMMCLLIPGPESPGKDFNAFLEPLMEELQLLWKGVDTADALSEAEDKMFSLKAAILWCIHDYPALCTLSGRTTKGYAACIHCDNDPLSRPLKGKNGYFGHFRFLPKKHRMRKGNMYLKAHKNHQKPCRFTVVELKELLEKVRQLSLEELQVAAMEKKAQSAMKRKESASMKKKQKSAS